MIGTLVATVTLFACVFAFLKGTSGRPGSSLHFLQGFTPKAWTRQYVDPKGGLTVMETETFALNEDYEKILAMAQSEHPQRTFLTKGVKQVNFMWQHPNGDLAYVAIASGTPGHTDIQLMESRRATWLDKARYWMDGVLGKKEPPRALARPATAAQKGP